MAVCSAELILRATTACSYIHPANVPRRASHPVLSKLRPSAWPLQSPFAQPATSFAPKERSVVIERITISPMQWQSERVSLRQHKAMPSRQYLFILHHLTTTQLLHQSEGQVSARFRSQTLTLGLQIQTKMLMFLTHRKLCAPPLMQMRR